MVSVPPAPWLKPRRQYGGASQSSCRSGGFLADTIYEELLARSAQESSRGAGQYFTPRPVIQTMCEVMQPTPDDRICGPAAGTGGFLCSAYQYVLDRHGNGLDRDELRALQTDLVEGMGLSPKVGRMCAMNAYLHGIGDDRVVVHTGHDSRRSRSGARAVHQARGTTGALTASARGIGAGVRLSCRRGGFA